jgi:ankyrin repeat protein
LAANNLKEFLEKIRDLPAFVDREVQPNGRGRFGEYPIHVAAQWGDCDAIESLFLVGADIEIKDEYGLTPLHRAAAQGHLESIKTLIRLGADPTILDCDRTTALEWARMYKHTDVIEYLEVAEKQRKQARAERD